MIQWIDISTVSQLDDIVSLSATQPVLILKHSTRCSISHMAKARLDRSSAPEGIPFYYLDLIQHRDISAEIANRFSVHHESPQIILLRNGECVYDQSHNGITMDEIIEQVQAAS